MKDPVTPEVYQQMTEQEKNAYHVKRRLQIQNWLYWFYFMDKEVLA